eukprot:m.168851 g.168851  ORF g.168851 m.168851 type:complete len:324 (+) comp17796_c2_seq1:546-1517(+)
MAHRERGASIGRRGTAAGGAACDKFQPSPARKNVCRNCFKLEDQHTKAKPTSSAERIRSGYFEKTGSSNSDKYQKRWFVLEPTELKYFKSDKEEKLSGSVALGDVTEVKVMDDTEYFVMITEKRVYRFKTATPAEATDWVGSLQPCVATAAKQPRARTKSDKRSRSSSLSKSRRAPSEKTAAAPPSAEPAKEGAAEEGAAKVPAPEPTVAPLEDKAEEPDAQHTTDAAAAAAAATTTATASVATASITATAAAAAASTATSQPSTASVRHCSVWERVPAGSVSWSRSWPERSAVSDTAAAASAVCRNPERVAKAARSKNASRH